MKSIFTLLVIVTITLAFNANAQETHVLKNSNDALLMQLIKQKKNIHFVISQSGQQPVVNFNEQTKNESAEQKSLSKNYSLPANAANNFHLTKDINVQTDANPANSDFVSDKPFAILNSVMYFSADDGINGSELWRSDGTAAGTYLVKDIQPGNNSSSPSELIVASNKLYFVTQSPSALWISDGTATGTIELLDLASSGPGVNGSFDITNVSGKVYFLKGSAYSTQVWKTDGTTAGTVLAKDLTGLAQSPTLFAAANGLYYFTIFSNESGRELWRSDGTDAGTFMVKNISDTADYFDGPFQLTTFNNKLYFSANDGTGRTLWYTDGTSAGTQKASASGGVILSTDFSDEFVNKPFALQLNNLYLSASTPATGNELFKYNINNGFSLIKDIIPGSRGGLLYNITNTDNFIAFVYQDTLKKKTQLWATLGFPYTTFLIKTADDYSSFFSRLTYSNGQLFFTSNTQGYGLELWKTYGTANTTVLVKDIYKGATSSVPLYFTSFKNSLYFNAASKSSGTELWKSGGTAENTNMVKEINSASTNYSGPNYFNKTAIGGNAGAAIGNKLFFSATKPETGYEVYTSDGTNTGTNLFKEVDAGENGSNPQTFTAKKSAVYFVAYTNSNNDYALNIFKIDSSGNTTQISNVSAGYIGTYSVADNGTVFYIVYPPSGLPQLWRSNGTIAGNIKLNDSVATTVYPVTVKTAYNKAFFAGTSLNNGTELWVSDGTAAGTKMVKDIASGNGSSNPYSLYAYNNNIFFGADDGAGVALWMSDGTSSGTVKLKSIQPYNTLYHGFDYNNFFCVVKGVLYLNASTDNNGAELWKTNGTAAGTKLVKDIADGTSSSDPSYLTNVNGSLFFSAFNQQLWKSDGTNAGTVLVKDLSGSSYYAFSERCVADNKFFFNKDQLLWVSDGTDAGTHQVNDNALNNVSLITNLAVAGNTVFFNGYTDKYNYELYAGDAAKVQTQTIANNVNNVRQSAFTASVLQNPVTSTLNLKVNSSKDETINIIVSNERGIAVARQKYVLLKGVNIINVNAFKWYNGIYTVNLTDNSGAEISLHVLK